MPDSFTITRTFAAPRELVYAAWTTPEHFAVWFGTEAVDVPVETVAMDVRVGGAWSAVMHLPDDGGTINWVGEYTEVDPPGRLAFTLTDSPDTDPGDPVLVILEEVDGGTAMTFTQPGHGFSDEQIEQTILGYNGFFDAMETLLAAQQS